MKTRATMTVLAVLVFTATCAPAATVFDLDATRNTTIWPNYANANSGTTQTLL